MSNRTRVSRKLFAPTPIANMHAASGDSVERDTTLATATATAMATSHSTRSYSLRRRSTINVAGPRLQASTSSSTQIVNGNGKQSQQKRTLRTSAKRKASAQLPAASDADSDPASASDFSNVDDAHTDSDDYTAKPKLKPKAKPKAVASSNKSKTDPDVATSSTSSPKKSAVSPFAISPRKSTSKPIKLNLEPHEAHPAPPNWQTVYSLLVKQRSNIIAPVDTMGCEENGRQDRRADADLPRLPESTQEAAKRERLTTLVSLMLSSQTKDPVTAEAVYNLQRTLPNGLCLQSLLQADDTTISSCIAKVGFWRRKTGYLKSAARILQDDFHGDIPRTLDELCSLPGVGPKMAFLALSSMGIQVGIGVDTHVHRITNRLGWVKTKTPEQTRLNLQSWLPVELHASINRLLVGFGQVICVPISPRCDLCIIGKNRLCPSYKPVHQKAALKRIKVHLLHSDIDSDNHDDNHISKAVEPVQVNSQSHSQSQSSAHPKIQVKLESDPTESKPNMHIADLIQLDQVTVKKEAHHDDNHNDKRHSPAPAVDKALDW